MKKKIHRYTLKRPEKDKEFSFIGLIEQITQYENNYAQVPFFYLEEIVKRIDASYRVLGIAFIGGEAITIKCVDAMQNKIALKIARPNFQKIGKRDISILDFAKGLYKKKAKDKNILKERFLEGAKIQKKLYQEIQIQRPDFYIPSVNKISTSPGIYYEMEWVESVPILQFLREKNSFSYTINTFGKLLNAVKFLHDISVVHRDLKSENILAWHNNSIVLLDWTLSKQVGDRHLTIPGQPIGTPGHGSLKAIGNKLGIEYTQIDDIYSLGYVLWEFVHTRQLPHQFKSWDDLRNKYKIAKFRNEMAALMPDALKPCFLKATEINEENRYQLISQFITEFEKASKNIIGIEKNVADLSIPVKEYERTVVTEEILIPEKLKSTVLYNNMQEFLTDYLSNFCVGCQFQCKEKICLRVLKMTANMIDKMKKEGLI